MQMTGNGFVMIRGISCIDLLMGSGANIFWYMCDNELGIGGVRSGHIEY